jgi:hypothetical protein
MASQNINQYVYPNLNAKFTLDITDISLTSDETGFNQEVVFSPYLIAQTFGNKLPIYFDTNDPNTVQNITLNYGVYNPSNIFVSQNYYNPFNVDLSCETEGSSCDIGLTGIDNGYVSRMTGQTIYFTNGIFGDGLKFNRSYFDRRFKMFQVTAYTDFPNIRFVGFSGSVAYEVVSKYDTFIGNYYELYGGFYQGFYKLHGYEYDIFPERVNKGWTVEMILKPRLTNEYTPGPGRTTLNQIYPNNKNIFFYLGTRAENKFYHYASGTPNCFTGYTRVTSLLDCLETCACCNKSVTNSRCIYVYPPRSVNGIHDPHVNYGCDLCGGNPSASASCGCSCGTNTCATCGWECRTHTCGAVILPTPTPTPSSTPSPSNCITSPPCEVCTTCQTCDTCNDCSYSGFSSIEDTCEKDPKWDVISNNLAFRLCGDPKNPQIGIRVLRFTGDCETTGSCATTGTTFATGYTTIDYCSPPIYPYCEAINPAYLDVEHWFQVDIVWERNTWLDYCDLRYRGGLDDITKTVMLQSLANNSVALIAPPYTRGTEDLEVDIIQLNEKWLLDSYFRKGKLKVYINGKIFYTIDDFEEVIPRALNTDKEKQVGVPFNISWGGGTQGLRENLTLVDCGIFPFYQQDPECLPTIDLTGTPLNGLTTNILLEQNFAGTFEGGISQFRMYVEPLSAPEVKHNFELRMTQFQMFNPDCPDCKVSACTPSDFEFIIAPATPTPTPTITRTPTLTPTNTTTQTPTQSVTPTISDTPTQTPSNTGTPTQTPTPTYTPTNTKTQTPTPTVTRTQTNTPDPTRTSTKTPTKTPTNTPTNTTTVTQTNTPQPTKTPTITPTKTPTNTPTNTATKTPTNTPNPTNTPTATITKTPSNTPTNTVTRTPRPTSAPTKTPEPTSTNTPTVTKTNTPTRTNTPTNTSTNAATPTQTKTPTNTKTPTTTPTITRTQTNTPDPTKTSTKTPTPTTTITPTKTITPTQTGTNEPQRRPITSTPTLTPTKTIKATPTTSSTPDPTRTPTKSVTPTKSITPSVSLTRTPTGTPEPTKTATQTNTPTKSITPSVSITRTPTDTPAPTRTPTKSITPTPSITPTNEPTRTPTTTVSLSRTVTPTMTSTKTSTPTPTRTPTNTSTKTATPTNTPSATVTKTPTKTPTPTQTNTCCTEWFVYGGASGTGTTFSIFTCNETTEIIIVAAQQTFNVACAYNVTIVSGNGTATANPLCICATPTPTPTKTATVTPTKTPTPTVTPTKTKTPTPTKTATPTKTPTKTPTPTPTQVCDYKQFQNSDCFEFMNDDPYDFMAP